jgi:hypothetical protein
MLDDSLCADAPRTPSAIPILSNASTSFFAFRFVLVWLQLKPLKLDGFFFGIFKLFEIGPQRPNTSFRIEFSLISFRTRV